MSQVRHTDADARQALSRLFAPIAADLALVDRRLQQELRHSDPFIDELAQHSFRIGGKRLRPALLLLTAQAVREVTPEHHTLAAVVEMVHTATLVHDDVLDEADVRRHLDTVNARWDNNTSVLLGDYLFSHAFYMASTLETTFGCRAIGESTNTVCEGELRQTNSSGNFWLSRDEYLGIIDAKTAELTACCCRLGAHYAGADEATVDRLTSYGRKLGMAFQIVDDLLDLEGEEQSTGKSLGTDLAHRKMTLPLIILRDQAAAADAERLQSLYEESDATHNSMLVDWLESSGALEQARRTAVEYAQEAAGELATLRDSEAKRMLAEIARFVIARNA
ncbi:polyprenyl synthetase family protein [Lacipirellula sp.]|uniref:polyprenyl synthetase family protein n=1 Tax=Lacipirellula sp. TaxID=2691419 RepID=UPI003D0B2648